MMLAPNGLWLPSNRLLPNKFRTKARGVKHVQWNVKSPPPEVTSRELGNTNMPSQASDVRGAVIPYKLWARRLPSRSRFYAAITPLSLDPYHPSLLNITGNF